MPDDQLHLVDWHLQYLNEDTEHLETWMLEPYELRVGGWCKKAKRAPQTSWKVVRRRWSKPGFSRFRPLTSHSHWASLDDIDVEREMAAIQALSTGGVLTIMKPHRPPPPPPTQLPTPCMPRRLSPDEEAANSCLEPCAEVTATTPPQTAAVAGPFPSGEAHDTVGLEEADEEGTPPIYMPPKLPASPPATSTPSTSPTLLGNKAAGPKVQAISHQLMTLSGEGEAARMAKALAISSRFTAAVSFTRNPKPSTCRSSCTHSPMAKPSSRVAHLISQFESRACCAN